MIEVERFIARSSMRAEWLEARACGVTATQISLASTPSGMKQVLAEIENPVEVVPNGYMEWGNQREPFIADVIKQRFSIMPNEWLIAAGGAGNDWMRATPDGLSRDDRFISEIKTSGKSLDIIPINYKRQIQFQLMVTGAEKCLFAYEQRLEGPEGFVPGVDVFTQWVERDEEMILTLINTAQKVQQHAIYFEKSKNEILKMRLEES